MELHPAGFVETGSCNCDGPRYVPIQPSRETPGILLSDKYITEFNKAENMPDSDFNLPFRNSVMYTKQLKSNFELLNDDQKMEIKQMIGEIGGIGALKNFKRESFGARTDGITPDNIGDHLDELYSDPDLKSGIDYWVSTQFSKNPSNIVACVFIILLFIGLGALCGYYMNK